ncbi:MAG: type II secretion system F family protein [Planctomycetota bacterium]|jgi:type IV pilus assembly protein PilC
MSSKLATAYNNLSTMLAAGLPVQRSLNTLIPGLNLRLRKAFLTLADGIEQGNPMSETMIQHPEVFAPVDIMIVEVGEKSGSLPDLIALLSRWHEMSARMFKRMISGLLLPVLVLTIAAFVFPLPAFVLGGWEINTYLLNVAGILLLFWIPATIIFFIVRMTPRTGPARRVLDNIVLRIPVLGSAVHKLAISRFCWAFHMLCKAGVPYIESVEMAISVTGNVVVADLFRPAVKRVKAGDSMSGGFSKKLPFDLVEMWKTGEESGRLDDISKRLADNYSEQAEFWFAEFTRWFPRFVYFLICILLIIMILQLAGNVRAMY